MTNSGIRTSRDNDFQEPANVHHEHAKFENVEICPKGRSQRKEGGECFAQLFYSFFKSGYVPDCLEKTGCKVKQPSRLLGCNFDISRCISQIIEKLPIVNSRRQTTTWKLESNPKMLSSGVRTPSDNCFQYLAKVHQKHANFENVKICPGGGSQRKNGGECFAPLF